MPNRVTADTVSGQRRRGCPLRGPATVVDLTPEDRDVQVKPDLKAPGLMPDNVEVEDAFYDHPSDSRPDNPGEAGPARLDDSRMTLAVKARRFRLIGVTAR